MSNHEGENAQSWRGTNLTDIYKGQGPWGFAVSPVVPSKYHHVLYELPVALTDPPKPHYRAQPCYGDDDHVKLPFCPKSTVRVEENDHVITRPRWEVITEALLSPIRSSVDLEKAISAYNGRVPKFAALHRFFTEVLEEDEAQHFFSKILPEVIRLALQLPDLLPGGLPLLKKRHRQSLSLSQVQVASLLANCFLCTFPWGKKGAKTYPAANFIRLFAADDRAKRQSSVSEKLKCICHYFRRVTATSPVGVITFERKFIPRDQLPRWDAMENNLGNSRVHVSSTGVIEDGLGLLQVDFANKFIGGGVLGYGCVQEEIRFVLYPELMVSRLFVEELNDNEAVEIIGAERFSNYSGYGDDFKWEGNVNDKTPFDDCGRRKTNLVVIDATKFNRSKDQYHASAILREINKAYVGFSSREKTNIAPVASGNWGCGAFKGDPNLKSLIQLVACSAANRDLVYFSFGNTELRDQFYKMYLFLANNKITISQLWKYLCRFCASNVSPDKLYSFIQQVHFDYKTSMLPTPKKVTGNTNKSNVASPPSDVIAKDEPSCEKKENVKVQTPRSVLGKFVIPKKGGGRNEEQKETSGVLAKDSSCEKGENVRVFGKFVIPKKSRPQTEGRKEGMVSSGSLLEIIDMIDGNVGHKSSGNSPEEGISTLFSELDKVESKTNLGSSSRMEDEDVIMETDDEDDVVVDEKPSRLLEEKKRKITDYFYRTPKPS